MLAIDKSVLDKLQKLLALAGSDNANEAEVALGKAQEIMQKHNITTRDIKVDGSGAYIEDTECPFIGQRASLWEQYLGKEVADAFHGEVVVSRGVEGPSLIFVAGRTDLLLIVDLYTRLQDTVRRMGLDYSRRVQSGNAVRVRNSYRLGMVRVIGRRLQIFREATEPREGAKNTSGYNGHDLMIIKSHAVQQRLKELCPNLGKGTKSNCKVETSAFQQGYKDGANVPLNRSVEGGGLYLGHDQGGARKAWNEQTNNQRGVV